MSNYYIREAQGSWNVTKAATLAAAKRAAVRAQMFQGTDAWVGVQMGDSIAPIAVKRADRLNMSVKGAWVEIDPDFASVGDFSAI